MLERRTLLILAALLAVYGLLVAPLYFSDAYAASPASLLLLVPGLSIYLFHKAGIPGLLEHNGLCGWGWCAPTPAGWAVLVLFWLPVAWVAAWIVAAAWARRGRGQADSGSVRE